ncbi:wall-associated receptor kinase-like 8 [Chenopodium quinoa]|uniref:wall-associated receptor kinase-like 8 n=1 Tax=Chenopodium quinoa TaxID=63459 RepID=UPI000B789F8E|nr:wall-associated receptor kinase-like 8 [Chenopodium quinoa]
MSLSVPWFLLFLLLVSMKAIALATLASNNTAIIPKNMLTARNTTKQGCQRECGNLTIPYPFGIGPECALDAWFMIKCDNTYNPPKSFLETPPDLKDREIVEITETEVVIRNKIASKCYRSQVNEIPERFGDLNIVGSPFTISHTANKLTVIGCNDYAMIGVYRGNQSHETPFYYGAGCMAMCAEPDKTNEVIPGSCSGLGCCQTSVPVGLQKFKIDLYRFFENPHNKTISELQPCTYAFFAREGSFSFSGASDLTPNGTVFKRTMQRVPVVLDWAFERSASCKEAKKNTTTYVCQSNSECVESDGGKYHCSCRSGYEGNPYLEPGCTDIDECAAGSNSPCSMDCKNIPGSYRCSCPTGYSGDGFKSRAGCVKISENSFKDLLIIRAFFATYTTGLGTSLGTILLLLAGWFLYAITKQRKQILQKRKNLERNSGMLLQQQISCSESVIAGMKIFTADELYRATDGFNKDRIHGKGGHGTVYKGMLSEGKLVAIKRTNIVNEIELQQFINEMVILSRINHRNIVQLLGCCLETEVPLLVYEFIQNGNLFHHIHNPNEDFPITWKMRLQIASDSAGALAYLHSSSSNPIFHRDIKSSNILLDDKYRAKISDFGTSILVAIDQTHATTRLMGTFGYLDPGYFHLGQYTEKSDVYSFGVVLIELLTAQKPLRTTNEEDRSLISWFHSHMKNFQLLDIIDPQIIEEVSKEEFLVIANLAMRCLNLEGKKRPTMNEVQQEIEVVRSHQLPQTNTPKWPKSQEVWTEIVKHGPSPENSSSSPSELPRSFSPR